MKKLMFGAAIAALFFATPAFAMDDMKCDDATMMKMQSDMDAMTDPAMKDKKDMAMKSMEMAKTAMKDNKMDDCMMQMKAAMDAMKK
jgi:hypothetical protein